ncbi:adenylyl-sulfate kinase [Helicobacter muridarum]|uniref:Adenylylsulfate kinase n=2 Tax=Helicobacter muridarum TaxID=216 RepID=A0A377PY35_9HELI|nr:adenylyl-sulfate kinase [Helicobacter muridarum]STQ86503.1 adenylylsulfate kinase [Helicobacter muridarum]
MYKIDLMKEGFGLVIWITGLSGSGKSTIGKALYARLAGCIKNVIYLDGDSLRDILGCSAYDRAGRIDMAMRRANLAYYLSSQGMVVIVTTISMFNEVYEYNSKLFSHYIQVYIECSMSELINRNQKDLYKGFIEGRVNQVVGMDIAYDEPIIDKSSIIINNDICECLDKKVDSILSRIAV